MSIIDESEMDEQDNGNMLELLKLLLSSIPFVLAVLIAAIMSSAVVFALYFITQVKFALLVVWAKRRPSWQSRQS